MREILDAVASTAPEIRDALPGRRVAAGETNPSGETQLAADRWADERLCEVLTDLESVGAYASEERESVVDAGGGYAVAVDPLDGSSNLKSNNPMATLVGVYDADLPAPGTDLVAAAYVLYGPITTMVAAVDGEVTEHVVEDGERTEVGPVELPDDPTVYGFGGRVPDWPDAFEAFAREIETELKLRYGGAMVADVSQVVTYGGIFAYPGLSSRPEGKLRLLFEGAPIGYIVEHAGGASSDGERSLLEVEPAELHRRVPVHVGNADLIARLERALA